MRLLINAKTYGTFIVMTCGVAVIFQIPYLRNSFYIPLCQTLNLTNMEFGVLSGLYSATCMFVYFVGGIFSDRLTSRWVLFLPFIATGALGFWFSCFPSYATLKLIYVLMGVSTVFTFFSTAISTVQSLGDSTMQGKLFGFMESGKGIVIGITTFAMTQLFNSLGGGKFGFEWVIRVYSLQCIIMGFAVLLIVPDRAPLKWRTVSIRKQILALISIPRIWVLGFVVFAAYSIYAIMSFIPPYMVKMYGISVENSTQLGTLRYLIQIVATFAGGLIADKIKSSYKVIIINFLLTIFTLIGFLVMQQHAVAWAVCLANFVIMASVTLCTKGLYYAIIDESRISRDITGSVSGIIACIGYSPDIFMYTMVGSWIDKGIDGYRMMFIYGITICIAGLIMVFSLMRVSLQKAEG